MNKTNDFGHSKETTGWFNKNGTRVKNKPIIEPDELKEAQITTSEDP